MWEEMWENTSENPLFIYKIQYLMRWFGTSPATNPRHQPLTHPLMIVPVGLQQDGKRRT